MTTLTHSLDATLSHGATLSFAEVTMIPPVAHAAADLPAMGCGLPRIVLASRSPRRRSLLTQAGIAHEAAAPEFDDAGMRPGAVTPEQWVASLAYLKAWAVARRVDSEMATLVIGADTACVVDEELIGTPLDRAEAEAMLRRFAGRTHDVVTGVALIETDTGRRHLFAERASVAMGAIHESDLARYLDSGEWAGKAGAYNLSERVEAGWPITFTGDPTAIMGLPMESLRAALGRITRLRQRAA